MPELKTVLLRYLHQLELLLAKIPDTCLTASLAPGMLNLGEHLRTCTQFSVRIYCPLLSLDIPALEASAANRSELLLQLAQTRHHLESLADVKHLDSQHLIYERAGFADLELAEPEFVYHYGLPNFYFHFCMVYAIARAQGVALSKGDFDGLHQYPEGFSFVTGKSADAEYDRHS